MRFGALSVALLACSAFGAAEEPPLRSPPPAPRGAGPERPPSLPVIAVTAEPVEVETPPDSRLRFLSGISVEAAHPLWGGLSGVTIDGDAFTVISDRGVLFTGRLERRAGGQLSGVAGLVTHRLLDPSGSPLPGPYADAEGLAAGPGRDVLVAFEGKPRVLRYDRPGAVAERLDLPREALSVDRNSGLEALATRPDGLIALIPERSGREERPFPVWLRMPGGDWSQASLDRAPPFLVTDAAFGPDGDLYVLERDFDLLSWFRARIRRAVIEDGRIVSVETLGLLRGADNLEGLDVRRASDGGTRLLLVSDDNFNALQRTLILEFEIRDAPAETREPG